MKGFAIATLAVLALGAAPTPSDTPEVAQARATAQYVLVATHARLAGAMADQGPLGALQACGAVTQEEARKHEQAGWRVRRVSLRWRNPADAPDAYEAQVLKAFERMRRQGTLRPETEHVGVALLDGKPVVRYLKPITILGAQCLQCHGSRTSIPADVQAALRTAYPKDGATGYRVGDLRGAVSVAVPIEHPQE